jgi:photosystem II stability/assembly factor-like uncharacterized protein
MSSFVRWAAVAVVLAGCAAEPLTPTTEVGADSGALVLRVTTNSAPAGFFPPYDTAQVVSDGGTYTLSRRTPGIVRTGVFTGVLPPGRYRVSRFETIGLNFKRWVDIPSAFGTFTVQAGQLTDLGTLVYVPSGGAKVLFARTSSEADTRELVAAAYPKLAATVLQRPILEWDTSANAADLAKGFAAMRARVAPINNPLVAPSGAVYAGSALGQVLARSDQGAWRQFDTGTAREILTVTEDGPAILAGGEEGFLVRSADSGRSWQRLTSPDRGAILHIVRRPNAGLMLVSLYERTLTVWEQSGESWQQRNEFPFERSFNTSTAQAPHVVSNERRLYVALPNGVIHAFGFADGQWQRYEAPFSLLTLATAGDLLYGYGIKFTSSLWISEDGGKSWRDLDTSRRAGAPVFSDPSTGYVIYIKEVFAAKMSVQMTRDGGRTWKETGDLPEAAARGVIVLRPMVVHPDGPTLLVFSVNGAVYSTRDLGATWTEERRRAY